MIQVGGTAGLLGVTIGSGQILDVKPDGNGGVYVLYESGATFILRRFNSTLTQVWTTAAITGTNAVFDVDPSSNAVLAYLDAAGDIQILGLDETNGNTDYSSSVAVNPITSTILSLSITADRETGGSDDPGGAYVCWIDDRLYDSRGLLLFGQVFDYTTNNLLWDSDTSGATDYTGQIIGVLSSFDDTEAAFEPVLYNDGGAPYGGLFIWQDYRNNRADIYYDTIGR